MARNGTGTYQLPAGNPVISGTTIATTWANPTMTDIANALTQSLSKDGQTAATADLPMGTHGHTGVRKATATTEYARADQVSELQTITNLAVIGGNPNTISGTLPLGQSDIALGQWFNAVWPATNTGAVSLNLGLLNMPVRGPTGAPLIGGELTAGAFVTLVRGAGIEYRITVPYLPTHGGTVTGNVVFDGGAQVIINGPAGTFRSLFFTTAGLSRWSVNTGPVAESGGNLGSNFSIKRYNDAGAFLDDAFSISRSVAVATFTGPVRTPFVQSTAVYSNGTQAGPAWTLDPFNGVRQKVTLSGNITAWTITAPIDNLPMQLILDVYQDAGGSHTLDATAIKVPAGTSKVLTTAGLARDRWVLDYDGAAWVGELKKGIA